MKKFVRIDKNSALVQVMAWRRINDDIVCCRQMATSPHPTPQHPRQAIIWTNTDPVVIRILSISYKCNTRIHLAFVIYFINTDSMSTF